MSEIKKSEKGFENVMKFANETGCRIHTAGFKNGDILEIDSKETITSQLKTIGTINYQEVSCKVNNTKQYKSVGSLFRSFLDDDDKQTKPNNFTDFYSCLDNLCGKKVKLTLIEGAKNFVYGDDTKKENVTVFRIEEVK